MAMLTGLNAHRQLDLTRARHFQADDVSLGDPQRFSRGDGEGGVDYPT